MDLQEIRKVIDEIDRRILHLLEQRMEQALLARRFKGRINDPERERQVQARIMECSSVLLQTPFLENMYEEILRESRAVQALGKRVIAFQGQHGAPGEAAAKAWDRSLVPLPCPNVSEMFEGVAAGVFDLCCVPVENTIGGVVEDVHEQLAKTPLHVRGAVEMPLHHCLLSLPGTDFGEIRTVYSHPTTLAQCNGFLERNRLLPAAYDDTAGAAKMLSETRPEAAAAIAGKPCADLYQLHVLVENLENPPGTRARFLILSKEE